MNKLRLLVGILATMLLFNACSSSKQARTYKKSVDGNWQLQLIKTEGITGKVKAQILDEADLNCFVGSEWIFNKSNSLGSYYISKNGGECVAIKRNIRWSIFEKAALPKMLQYKRVDAKYKDIDEGKAGFRFTIVTLDDNNMQLKNEVTFEGKPVTFIYNFVKNK